MEQNLNQSVNLIDKDGNIVQKQNNNNYNNLSYDNDNFDSSVLDLEGEKMKRIFANNYDLALTQMYDKCAKQCFNSFKIGKLTKSEENCLVPCHFKYLQSINIGNDIMNFILHKNNSLI